VSQSVDRALTILVSCAGAPRRLGELADELAVHKSTALRLLQALERRAFMRRTHDGLWAIGFGLTDVAQAALDHIDVRVAARPHLSRLGRELGHTLHLAELSGTDVVYVDKVEGDGAVRMRSRVGAAAQLHTAGVAKVVIAFASDEVRRAALASASYQRFTATTLTSPAALARQLDEVRARGWAADDGECEDYLSCVAVPIRDHTGAVAAGMSLTALRAIEPLDALTRHIPDLTRAAARISRELGWDGRKGLDEPAEAGADRNGFTLAERSR
jgi:DNA-binding IclR family transcriptional regulator